MAQIQTRMTKQRSIILEELCKQKTHPTADELHIIVRGRLPRISLGTVYRNLEFLAETGKIIKLETAGTTKRFDGDISEHRHVRCVRCGCIADIKVSGSPPDIKNLKIDGFKITAVRIEYSGLCTGCDIVQ